MPDASGGQTHLAVSMPCFAGRARELNALREAAADGQALVFVEGEAGIGKTRLVRELLRDRADDEVVVAACPPLRHPQTLAPIVEAVRRAARNPGSLGLSALAGALRPLLPEWTDVLPPTPEPVQDAAAAKHRLFRALGELLERVTTRLLVVEDVHWADEASLEFLLFLRAQPVQPVAVVLTTRPRDVPSGSLLRGLSAHSPHRGPATRIQLGPLDVAQTSVLVSSMVAGQPVSAEFAGFLHARTDGVPLAIEESVRLLAERADVAWRDGELVSRELSKIEVPATIRDAVLERAERLSPHARAVLRAAAVLDEPAHGSALHSVCGLEPADFAAGLAEALASGLVAEHRGRDAGFRHALASQAIYEAIPAADLRVLHQRAGQALEGAASAQPGQLARHFLAAGDNGRWARYAEQAADYAVAAGDESAADRILHELIVRGERSAPAMERLAAKVSFAAELPWHELITALRSVIGTPGVTGGQEAMLRLQLARLLENTEDYGAARREVVQAVHGLPPGSIEAVVAMRRLAWPYDPSSPAREHLRWLRRSEAVPVTATAVDRLRLRLERVTSLLALGENAGWTEAAQVLDSGEPSYLLAAIGKNVAHHAIRWGRFDEARRRLTATDLIADEHGYRRLRATLLVSQAQLDWFTGAWDSLADRSARLAADTALMALAKAEALVITGHLLAVTGDHAGAREHLSAALARFRQHGIADYLMEPAAALARLSLAEGDVAEALKITDEPAAVLRAKGIWVWATEPAPVRVAALCAAGRKSEAAELVAAMTAGLRGRDAPAANAALILCRAILAESRAEHDSAAASFERAAAAWQALPRPYDALLARERRARCLLAAGDRQAALAELREVAVGLAKLGASGDADRLLSELRGLGVVVRRPVSGRPGYRGGLSPRELEIVTLLAAGKTDKEIADELVVSPKTVATHVTSARRKLRAPSRIALAVAVMDAGFVGGRQL